MKNALYAGPILLFTFLFIANIYTAKAQGWQWVASATCPKAQCEGGPVAVDQQGNVYACGSLSQSGGATVYPLENIFGLDTLIDSSGMFSMVIVSMDSAGNPRWQIGTQFGQPLANEIKADPYGNIYILGQSYTSGFHFGGIYFSSTSSNPYFCAKITSAGTVLWIREIPEVIPAMFSINSTGNLYFTGAFLHVATIGTTTLIDSNNNFTTDVYLAKYDSAFNPLWALCFGSDSENAAINIALTGDSDVYISGTYASQSMTIGTYTVTSGPPTARLNIFTAKFSGNGNLLWAKSVVADTSAFIHGGSTDNYGNVYLTGGYTGNISFGPYAMPPALGIYRLFLWKYDSSGNPQWARTLEDNQMQWASTVNADNCGNIWLLGMYTSAGSVTFPDPMFMAHYDNAGNFIDTVYIGSGGDDGGYMTVDNKGSVYVSSDYFGSTYFGSNYLQLSDSSIEDLYIAKYIYDLPSCVPDTIPLQSSELTTKQSIVIYPNPTAMQLSIESGNEFINAICIFNLLGQVVHNTPVLGSITHVTVDVSNLPSGVYFIKVNNTEVRKFVKE